MILIFQKALKLTDFLAEGIKPLLQFSALLEWFLDDFDLSFFGFQVQVLIGVNLFLKFVDHFLEKLWCEF